MKPILKAMALLSGGSAVSLVLGLISAKTMALLLGPRGVGYLGLLQSTLGLAVLVATSGGASNGMMRAVARARSLDDRADEKAARVAAWIIWAVCSAAAALLMLLLREPLARLTLGSAARASAIFPLVAAVALTLATSVQANVLAAYQRVGDIARLNVWNSIIGPATLLPIAWIWRERGLPWALCAATACSTAASVWLARRAPTSAVHVDSARVASAARGLLQFGLPFTASGLASTGVQFAMPIIVLHVLGSTEVGFYRAAAGISITYLGFLLASLGQDYYPRLSASSDDDEGLVRLINEQARVLLLIVGPVILALIALVPRLVPLIYTRQFMPTVSLLQWQLVGDLVKISGWTMGFAILARCGGTAYLVAELVGGVALLASSWVGVRTFQLEGLGAAFVISGAISWLVYWSMLRRAIGFTLSRDNRVRLASFLVCAFIIRLLPYARLDALVLPIGLTLAAITGFISLRIILDEVGGLRGMLTWRSAS